MPRTLITTLALMACSPTPSVDSVADAEVSVGEARGGLVLTVDDDLYWGEARTWTVTGAAPGERVYFVYSVGGELVDGFCPGALGGACMALAPPARLFDNSDADADGVATGSFDFPPLELLGFSMTIQAAIPRGVDSVVTNVMTLPVGSRLSAPEARDDGYVTDEDAELVVGAPGILANDFDADGDELEIFLVERPTDGALVVEPDGSFTYSPRPDFYGVDSFTYQVFDGFYGSEEAVVALTVTSVNDIPFGVIEGYEATEDTVLAVSALDGVLTNDLDLEGDPLAAELVVPPANGTLALRSDGSFDFTPDPNFWGEDAFTYRPVDADPGPDVTVPLLVLPVNDAPVAAGEGYATSEDVLLEVLAEDGLLANDTDVDEDRLEAVLVDSPSNGELLVGRDGSFGYLPDAGWSGLDSFTYQAVDPGGLSSAVVLVTVSVGDVNDPPFALPDRYEGTEDIPVVISSLDGVLANDTDLDGDPLSAALEVGPASGTLSLAGDGGFTYTPDPDFWGEDSFTYRASDGLGGESEATTVTLGVAPVNDLPVALDDAYATPFGEPLVVSALDGLLANDSDRDGEIEPRPGETVPAGGQLVLNLDGSFTYTPSLCFTGRDTFTYVAFDGADESSEATVTIDVGAPTVDEDAFCNAYQPVLPRVPYDELEFEGYPVRTLIPPAPIGLLYTFHGSGGSVATATQIEYTEIYNLLYDAGIGVVITESTQREPTAEWDTFPADALRNEDWPRLASLRDYLIDTTGVTSGTPIFGLGFSNGGNFTATFGEIALDEGWPFVGMAIHNSSPFGAPRVAGWWTTNVNDDKGTPASVRSAYLSHAATGSPSEYRLAEEFPIHPMYFRKVPGTDHQFSQDIFDDLVAFGMLDADGNRLPPVDEMDGAFRSWVRETTIAGPERFTARIRPAWGDHRVSSSYAEEEVAFLLGALD